MEIDRELQEAYNQCALDSFKELKEKERAGCQCSFCESQRGLLTAEQREAVEIALEYLVDDPNDGGDFEIPKAIRGLKDLLGGKAGGKDEKL